MYRGKKIAALITARGGSKGIPKKNITKLCGKPLIQWTVESAMKSGYIDKVFLSTDNDEIINSVKKFPVEVPFKRPKNLSSDKATSTDVILHFIEWMKKSSNEYDVLLLLQPTSPFRKSEHIDSSIKKFIASKEALSLISVTENVKSPYLSRKLNSNGYIENLFNVKSEKRRQDIPVTYYINGAIYLTEVKNFEKYKTFQTPKTLSYIMPYYSSIDIDEPMDLKIAELYYKNKLV
ncbi:MAG: acylneuraminate cytidylyltransferase family protein [Ignavibacteria bacterium]|nr:acylneuraminate cytidylyltransferase family protein [Ignavibacteria bacterium]